jgi:hypothetical protein
MSVRDQPPLAPASTPPPWPPRVIRLAAPEGRVRCLWARIPCWPVFGFLRRRPRAGFSSAGRKMGRATTAAWHERSE